MDERDLDKRELADLLDRLCEHPFADGEDKQVLHAVPRLAQALADTAAVRQDSGRQDFGRAEEEGLAALAAILSGTATDAQARAFREAAIASAAVRAEAQSALAFIEAVDAAPHAAPAHLLEEVLGRGHSPAHDKPGIWSLVAAPVAAAPALQAHAVQAPALQAPAIRARPPRWSARRAAAALAFAVVMLGFGVSGSWLWQMEPGAPLTSAPVMRRAPATSGTPVTSSAPVAPVSASSGMTVPAGDPAGAPASVLDIAPRIAPVVPHAAPKPLPAPSQASAQAPASADPCAPAASLAKSATASEARARKPASSPEPKMAVASVPNVGCAEADRAARAGAGPTRTEPAAALSNRSFDRTPFGPAAPPPPGPPAAPPAAAFAPER